MRRLFLSALVLTLLFLPQKATAETKKPLKIGITSIIIRPDIHLNNIISDYFSLKMGRSAEVVVRKTYKEIADLVARGEVDVGLISASSYLSHKNRKKISIIAVPVKNDSPYYYTYFISRNTSEYESILDLKDKIFAFVDIHSTSGWLIPVYELMKAGEIPEGFFKKSIFTGSHTNSIEAVAVGLADGAMVDGFVWDSLNLRDPRITSLTKIISKTGMVPLPPVVAGKNLGAKRITSVKKVFLQMNKDEGGRKILKELNFDGFIEGDEKYYSGVEEMLIKVLPNP